MGVYIKGMEMPTNCDECPLYTCMHNHDDCPLVPVPEHGRLIDADAIDMNYIYIRDDGMKIYTQRAIDNAPTIIPAEEGE